MRRVLALDDRARWGAQRKAHLTRDLPKQLFTCKRKIVFSEVWATREPLATKDLRSGGYNPKPEITSAGWRALASNGKSAETAERRLIDRRGNFLLLNPFRNRVLKLL